MVKGLKRHFSWKIKTADAENTRGKAKGGGVIVGIMTDINYELI